MKRHFFVVFGSICPKEKPETLFHAKWVEKPSQTDIIRNYRRLMVQKMRNTDCPCWKERDDEMSIKKGNRMERAHGMRRTDEMKRKRLRCVPLFFTVFSLALSGCGRTAGQQETGLDAGTVSASSAETGAEESISGAEPVSAENGEKIVFPERYCETIGNVTFNMDVVVNTDLTAGSMVTAKAQMQKVDRENAFLLLFGSIEEYDTYDYEEEDEYGKNAHSVTYVSPEETTLAYGPQSSKFDYMERDLMPYVQNAFVPFRDEHFNADLYSRSAQLAFMTREEAFETVQKVLEEIGVAIEPVYVGYALDYKTMQSQEYHEDMDGKIDRSQYKAQWTDEDDCYYFYINQTYKGLPLYHVYNQVFADVEEINAPIQAVVSGEGLEWLNIEKVFAVSEEKGGVSLADLKAVIQTAADKYNQVLGSSAYEIVKAELYYYVDLSSGKGTYDVKPVWILTGNEKGGPNLQIIIDAQTAEEIVP